MAEDDVSADLSAETLRRLKPDRLVDLLATLDLSRFDADTFARIVTRASSGQVRAILAVPDLRARVLDEVFRRMGDHLRPDRAAHTSAVVHWRLTGGTGDGGYDRYETVIEHGTCVVHRESTRDPRATITLHPADFLRLITHNASGPVLFMTGKLKINGDLGFAASLTSLFDLPRG